MRDKIASALQRDIRYTDRVSNPVRRFGLAIFASLFAATAIAQETDGPLSAAAPAEEAVQADTLPSLESLTHGRACLPAMTNVQARNTRSLDGQWQYILDALGEINRRPEKTRTAVFEDVRDADIPPNVIKEYDWVRAPLIEVPGSWNVQIPELTWYDQWMWLKRHFDVSKSDRARRFIYFEGANYETVVYLNGKKVGEHVGGFTPFCFEVTDLLKEGENTLAVGVNAEQDETTIPPKRADWSNFGGITRPVHLVETPSTFVSNYSLTLQSDGKIFLKRNSTASESANRFACAFLSLASTNATAAMVKAALSRRRLILEKICLAGALRARRYMMLRLKAAVKQFATGSAFALCL